MTKIAVKPEGRKKYSSVLSTLIERRKMAAGRRQKPKGHAVEEETTSWKSQEDGRRQCEEED